MLTRPEAAALALFALGGDHQRVDTEDVALRVAELAPGMFAWRKYRDRIDKELVRVALSDARLKSGYAIGSHSHGWMLTPKGLEFARAAARKVKAEFRTERRRPEDRQLQRDRARLLNAEAFAQFTANGIEGVNPDQADAFFRLNVYVRGEGRERKIARIENQFGEDKELGAAVHALAGIARERDR